MRSLLLLVPVVLASCVGVADLAEGDPSSSGSGSGGGGAPEFEQCSVDADCVLAGATCCACPTFAVGVSDPVHRACVGVMCPPTNSCSDNVTAVCSEHRCKLACAPVACPEACPDGFAMDLNGCLSCACATPVAGGCTSAMDCTRTRGDCCGCARGGEDIAVLVRDREEHDAGLMCEADPLCPGINVCTGDTPQCVQGACALLPPTLPPGVCGRPDLPACPSGEVCTVNLSDPANMQGLGICAPL